ncbi:MAG: hypothetical protein ACRYFX_00955 [Janthinobacterium lividum]
MHTRRWARAFGFYFVYRMGVITLRQQVMLTGLLFGLLLLAVPRAGYEGDLDFWARWATYSFVNGLSSVYQVPDNNYNPFYHYILWAYGHLVGSVQAIRYYAPWLKAATLLFDFAGAFWAASLVPERSRRFGLALLLLLNIGYLYNTLIWVQVDAIYTCFAFGTVVLAAQRRLPGSMLCYVLAIATKTQAIIFLPPLLLLWLPQWYHRPRRLAAGLLAGAALATLLLAPFIWGGWESYLPRIIDLNLHAANVYPYLSCNAYNGWYLATSFPTPSVVVDTLPFAGLTYRHWGVLSFCVASVVALAPLLAAAWRAWRSRLSQVPSVPLVLLSAGIVPLLFTFCNTQMHERYWHPAVLFLAAYGFVRRDYLPLALVSVAYYLQLERVFGYLKLSHYDWFLFNERFIAGLFAALIILVLVKIYRLAPWREAPAQVVAAPVVDVAG